MPTQSPATSTRLSRRFFVAGLCAAAASLGPGACATEPMAASTAGSSAVGLSVIDRDTGEALAVHRLRERSYVAGTPGQRYALRLSNRTANRLLVVLSVDGINVVSGETAGWHQTGYVLDPWRTHDIAGWRKSDTEVAAFEFAALSQTYAARTGRPAHVGVIGMAVFRERAQPSAGPPVAESARPAPSSAAADDASRRVGEPPQAPRPDEPAARASAAGAADGTAAAGAGAQALSSRAMESARLALRREAPAERLGTGHGQREWSYTRRVSFERASERPDAVVEIRYDSRENLLAAGVIRRPPPDPVRPQPFPNSDAWAGFVPDPPER